MVWVSNRSGAPIDVQITNATGGDAGVFNIPAFAVESGPLNHWQRGGDEVAMIMRIGQPPTMIPVGMNAYVIVFVDNALVNQNFIANPLA
jgi:hypothetical protein